MVARLLTASLATGTPATRLESPAWRDRTRAGSQFVEVRVPQAKPLLVRLSPFRLNIRPARSARTVRDEILAVLPELIDEHGELMMCDLLSRLNPEGDNRRRWAVEKAVWRMANTAPFETLSLEHLSQGRYRSPH